MAETVEARRIELGLSPSEFAAAAELTAQGLAPLRKGYRRRYQEKLKRGVAKALRWENDAVDLLLSGLPPRPLGEGGGVDTTTIGVLAEQLSPEGQARVEAYIRGLLDAERERE